MSNTIICRKCAGNHLTIKCGKNTESNTTNVDTLSQSDKDISNANSVTNHTTNYTNTNYDKKIPDNKYRERTNKKVYTVKLSELPNDITESELYKLLQNWGHIVKIKIMSYSECCIAYLDFIYLEEATYFVSALDSTPFDLLIIKAQLCN